MIGSTPMAGEANWHPVHRANAMLRAALLSSARAAESSPESYGAGSLSYAVESVFQGPVSITFPRPLAVRLEALAREQNDAFPGFETMMRELHRDSPQEDDGANFYTPDELETDVALELEHDASPPLDVRSLLEEFRRRQRHASILVAGSILTATVLTIGGVLLVASLAVPGPLPGGNDQSLSRSTSIAWQPPVLNSNAGLTAAVSTNQAAKGEPLAVPGILSATSRASSPQTQTILATSGRQIALAPLLPAGQAGYFLIRGLPLAATLSTGRQSDSGTWLVKAEHAGDLRLAIGEVAEGDYPIEIYVLQSGDQPQARRSLMLRVEAPSRIHQAAASGKDWALALLDVVPAARAAEAPAPVETEAVRQRAQRLLAEGDIAGARLLLLYLAERDEGEAAYELARTYDREMLDALGAKGLAGDLANARGWYERAAKRGNAKAKERLQILASLTETGPSD
jgi:hypothetical protein